MNLRTLLFVPLITIVLTHAVHAQQTITPKQRCGTVEYYKELFKLHPEQKRLFEDNQRKLLSKSPTFGAERITAIKDTVPVVIHVVASSSIQTQVTDAILKSQIDVLNEDFKGLNADSTRIPAAFKPLYGKFDITFILAKTDPIGALTNGIERRTSASTYSAGTADNAKQFATGGLDAWDPNNYLNLWVVSFGSTSVLGISVFPGDSRPLYLHGFVCDYRAFGRGGSYLDIDFNKGRTTTHELGHFWNLIHIWGDDGNACSGNDFDGSPAGLDDTPNQAGSTSGNPDPAATGAVVTDGCSAVAPGIMYQNYMDYTNDIGMVMFTKGQNSRMETALLNSPDRSGILNSTTYKPPFFYTNDLEMIGISNLPEVQCNTQLSPSVTVKNKSLQTITSFKLNYQLDNGSTVTQAVTGISIGPLAMFTTPVNPFTTTTGNHQLTFFTSVPVSADSTGDGFKINDTLKKSVSIAGSIQAPLTEGFEGNFIPENWASANPDNSLTWAKINQGNNSSSSAYINTYNYSSLKQRDELYSPKINYPAVDSVLLYFDIAAVPLKPAGITDTLEVLITLDCGLSFTSVYKKWGTQLQTTDVSNAEFFPSGSTQWKSEQVDLSAYKANGSIQVVFRSANNNGNNIFLDNIQVKTRILPFRLKKEGRIVLPNPFTNSFDIWHFQQPTTLRFVTVYNLAGQIIWSKEFKSDAQKIISVDLSGKQAGIYFVHLGYQDTSKNTVEKVVKVN